MYFINCKKGLNRYTTKKITSKVFHHKDEQITSNLIVLHGYMGVSYMNKNPGFSQFH